MYLLCRFLLLDMAKCGANLFYKPIEINVACIILANYFLRGELILGKAKEEDIYQDESRAEIEIETPPIYDEILPPSYMLKLPSYDT